jgi:ABC-2 type transport system permease protein
MNAHKYGTLIRREYWEHRGALKWTPVWIGGSILLMTILAWITGQSVIFRMDGSEHLVEGSLKALEQSATAEQLRTASAAMLYGTGAIFLVAMFFILVFYCLGALYDDRRDRSLLFWRSLPVSDLETVLSKLALVLVVAPLIYFVSIIAFQLILLAVAGGMIAIQGGSPVKLLWGPVEPLAYWSRLAVALGLQALWLLPLYGWLLLVSAWARSKPFLWALLIPVVLAVLETWLKFTASLQLGYKFGDLLLARVVTGFAPMSFHAKVGDGQINIGGSADEKYSTEWSVLLERAVSADLWVGVLIGVAFIAAAVWLRRYRDDSATT